MAEPAPHKTYRALRIFHGALLRHRRLVAGTSSRAHPAISAVFPPVNSVLDNSSKLAAKQSGLTHLSASRWIAVRRQVRAVQCRRAETTAPRDRNRESVRSACQSTLCCPLHSPEKRLFRKNDRVNVVCFQLIIYVLSTNLTNFKWSKLIVYHYKEVSIKGILPVWYQVLNRVIYGLYQ